MALTSDQDIAGILSEVETIALVGASDKPHRPSYRVMQFLLSHGYTVVPVNPMLTGTQLQGQRVYGSLDEAPCPIDMIDVFRNASHLPSIVDDAIRLGIGCLWAQLDVIDEKASLRAECQGIRVVMDRCPAIEWPRLKQAGFL